MSEGGSLVRRLLIVVLFGLVVAGGAAVTWQAMGRAKLVEQDLVAARALLTQAGGVEAGKLERRLRLVDRAERRTTSAEQRLGRWPLRQLGALPLVGRDVRVARAVAASATATVRSTRQVVTALQPVQTRAPTKASIEAAAAALLALHGTLEQDLERVRATRPLVTASTRTRYLEAPSSTSATAERAGQGLKVAASLYGAPGTARWFLAFQNPAELRGTGGLIGEYGILESSPTGPKLVKVDHYSDLNERTNEGVDLPSPLAARYERYAIGQDWSAVNIPPDMPTVGRLITELYRRTTRDRIDGVIAADPLAVAQILRVTGPIQAGGIWMDADNVADETLVQAYVRYEADNDARRRFLEELARASFQAFRRGLAAEPFQLVRNLGTAARGRHVQVFVADPAGQRAVAGLGLSGSAAAPKTGDYLMPVGINAGGNKLDAFLRRTVRWRVRLSPDGAASTSARFILANDGPASGLPRYIIGPYDSEFRAGQNEQIATLYVAGGYGFTKATVDGRPTGAEAQADFGGLALTQQVGVQAKSTVILGYELSRATATERLGDGRLRYRLLLRPQATVRPDQARITVEAPNGWRFDQAAPGSRLAGRTASWAGLSRSRNQVRRAELRCRCCLRWRAGPRPAAGPAPGGRRRRRRGCG
jgi:hypothetical protein